MARGDDMTRALRPLDMVGNDTNRGKSVTLVPPTGANVIGQPQGILRIESRCAPAEILGVQFALTVPGLPADSTNGRDPNRLVYPHVRAKLAMGVGGVTNEAEVDVLNGTQIGVIAEDLRVSAFYIKQSPEWAPDEDLDAPTFEITATAGYHAFGRNTNSARLTDLVMIEANPGVGPPNSKLLRVPNFAASFMIIPVGGQVISQAVLSGYGAFTSTYSVDGQLRNAGQYNVENGFVIPNGMRWLEITNTQAADTNQYCYVVWGLAL